MAYTQDELASIAEIRNLQERYCRGIDRTDAEMLRTVYWEDAIDEHGSFRGDREEYIEWVIPLVRSRFKALQHVLGQTYVEFEGADVAYAETYFVQHSLLHDGISYESPGRYLDQLERRNGEWRVAARKTMMSYFTQAVPADMDKHAAAGFPMGTQDREDPSYRRGALLG